MEAPSISHNAWWSVQLLYPHLTPLLLPIYSSWFSIRSLCFNLLVVTLCLPLSLCCNMWRLKKAQRIINRFLPSLSQWSLFCFGFFFFFWVIFDAIGRIELVKLKKGKKEWTLREFLRNFFLTLIWTRIGPVSWPISENFSRFQSESKNWKKKQRKKKRMQIGASSANRCVAKCRVRVRLP